jgi:hypothetical protein
MMRGTAVPAETDLLCEGCGYVLNGLPGGGQCPECGKPMAESAPERRALPAWEQGPPRGRLTGFLATSAAVIFRPTSFYRTLAIRDDTERAFAFAQMYWWAASLLIGWAGFAHTVWLFRGDARRLVDVRIWLALAFCVFVVLFLTTMIAARLTHWEASYRGIRLPLAVVRRGMYYHAAHYLPVALVTAVTVFAFRFTWLHHQATLSPKFMTWYLYVLCAEVVLAAAYLFKTYWIGMRNIMYGNR